MTDQIAFADTVVPRLTAAKDKLKAKGWRCPSIEIGFKVLGDYGPVMWGTVHLGAQERLDVKWVDAKTVEELLAALDTAVEGAPTAAQKLRELETMFAKLTPQEVMALGMRRFEIEQTIRELRGESR